MVVKTVVYLGHLGEQYIGLAPKLWHSKTLSNQCKATDRREKQWDKEVEVKQMSMKMFLPFNSITDHLSISFSFT